MSISYPSIRIHPSVMQFYTEEGMTIAGVIVLVALAGYDGLTPRWLPPYIIGVAVILMLYLLYRYLYVTRTVYVITSEQLKYECGVFSCCRDFIELYRVIDYSEQRSFLQMLLGIKTISIYSGDRPHPRLDLVGISNKVDLIPTIRERVELNKKRHNIHEFTNTYNIPQIGKSFVSLW